MKSFHYRRCYTGPLQAVVFDWAGTTIDFGSMAPVVVFQRVFEAAGVPVSTEEARLPMGVHKREHIAKVMAIPAVRTRWQERWGRDPEPTDVERLFAAFVPLQISVLQEHAELIPGMLEVLAELRRRHCKIGSTTGYTKEMTAIVAKEAARQGYTPDAIVSACEVPAGRPEPFMLFQNLSLLRVSPVEAVVKVDDTLAGIEEGLNAGCWTIGLALSGNEVGLTQAAWNELGSEAKAQRKAAAYERHARAGAHYVVDSVADILPCLDDINARLGRGERP